MKGSFRRRRRGHRASWNWALTGTLEFQDTIASENSIVGPLFPAARVDWMLENGRGRDHLTINTILLWLDFIWVNPESTAKAIMPVDFWVLKERWDSETIPELYNPYQSPAVPTAITNWETDTSSELDGLDPYLWTHHMSQYVAGGVTNFLNFGELGGQGNSGPNMAGNCSLQPLNNIRAAWQPDVVIRTKRRMMKGDQLNIGMTFNDGDATFGNGVIYNCSYHCRVLTS